MKYLPFEKAAADGNQVLRGEILTDKTDIAKSNYAKRPFVYFMPEKKTFLLSANPLGMDEIQYKGDIYYQLDRDEFMARKTAISMSKAKDYKVIELDDKGQEIQKSLFSEYFVLFGSRSGNEKFNPAQSGTIEIAEGVTLHAPWAKVTVRDAQTEQEAKPQSEQNREAETKYGPIPEEFLRRARNLHTFYSGVGTSSNGKTYSGFHKYYDPAKW